MRPRAWHGGNAPSADRVFTVETPCSYGGCTGKSRCLAVLSTGRTWLLVGGGAREAVADAGPGVELGHAFDGDPIVALAIELVQGRI